MLTGIDDVDWASMGHAYTESATDVPGLLRGLASDDPAERDIALDGMYGAVHHQGDVYDSTVACVPFLFELAALDGLADRAALVHLLCSIGGEERPDPAEIGGLFEDEEEDAAFVQPFLDAWAAVRERADGFLGLLADAEAEVRAAAALALSRVHPDPARAFGVLRERLSVEHDSTAQCALVEAIGRLGARHPESLGAEAGVLLRASVLSDRSGPEVRLTGLARLADCAPESLPEDTVAIALAVMRLACEAKGSGARATEPERDRPRTDTMVSYLRELKASQAAAVDADATDDLLVELHHALGDRTDLRYALLVGQLRSPDRGQRMAAVSMAGALMTGWRVPDDEPLIALAEQLDDPEPRLNKAALDELRRLAPIARMVADEVVAYIEGWADSGREETDADLGWSATALGKAAEVLTLQGDERIVNALTSILGRLDLPEQIVRWLEAFGPEAVAELGPVLHERVVALGPDDRGDTLHRLLAGLGVLTPPESLPLVLALLRDSHDDPATRRHALKATARYGRAAAEAAPLLRELLADPTAPVPDRLETAAALWSVTGDAKAVLPALRSGLGCDGRYESRLALRLIGSLGPAATPLADELRARDRGVEEAVALWKVTGDPAEALPAFLHHWTTTPMARPRIAVCLTEMGPAAAPALPLIRAELASPRRHRTDNSSMTAAASVNIRGDVTEDEDLLAACRRIVTELETTAS
ncbi:MULTISPECIES: HEAT repeat domain-containing protein [Streptomyces]|uniref:HEAT repeat domain-containing protein n=1 Tax=Streptomyces griseiscabiei TaxID=2993540 RepID=A0ABU4L867_9ACTN|nr:MULTISPECIES: HEAT repeat domain-containing protein [Streptomyces]MBZ3905148.1 HEAT repeat domain-containing protein [Streptomyces griseiscabiei]MDX2911931.1 HEAT repeat domain-containing protein [Streptomyces griseiscabiei]